MPSDFLDLSSEPDSTPEQAGEGPSARRFIGINFACCSAYSRIYLNKERNAYVGHCPKCSRRVTVKIGPGGSDTRFFTAY